MTRKLYPKLKAIQKLVWTNDDMMDQETLFELQDKLGRLLLQVAADENKTDDLVKSFPWLYKPRTKEA